MKRKVQTETVVPEWKSERQSTAAFEADDKGYYKTQGLIELRIDRFEQFVHDGKRRYSTLTHIRGLPWRLRVETNESNNPDGQLSSKLFSAYLCCVNYSNNQTWECEAEVTLSVVAQKEGVKDFIRDFNQNFKDKKNAWGITNLSCNILLDPAKGFIKDDVVIVRADVKPTSIKMMSRIRDIGNGQLFSSSTKYPWDFVLIIQGKKVHVQKSLLAIHSNYFKDQFTKHEHDSSAILQEVDYHEFIEVLCVIYPTPFQITAENVETISKHAFQFDMAGLLSQCEMYLMQNIKQFGTAKSLLTADRYELVLLLGKIIDEIKTIADIKGMKPEYDALPYRTKRMLLEKICLKRPVSSPAPVPEDFDITTDRAAEILQKLASSVCCPSDGVLVVENNRIFIHKTYLAVYSEYFKALFQSEFAERNQDEIVLEEVGYSEILELLTIIYPTNSDITDKKVGVILKLADRFVMPMILERCKKQLQNSTQISAARKLWLAQRYNLPDLQEEYAQKCKEMSDVEKLRSEPEYGLLDDKTVALILDSVSG